MLSIVAYIPEWVVRIKKSDRCALSVNVEICHSASLCVITIWRQNQRVWAPFLALKRTTCITFNRNEHLVCKLRRTLYGLKQSPRVWYQTIDKLFADMGFKRVEGDYGLYVIWNTDVKCIIALYVDDLLLALTKNPAYHSRTKHIDIRHH